MERTYEAYNSLLLNDKPHRAWFKLTSALKRLPECARKWTL
jgi:hypothetical protein